MKLGDEERQQLTNMTRKGMLSARVMTRTRLLLLSDQGLLDRDVAERQGVSAATVAAPFGASSQQAASTPLSTRSPVPNKPRNSRRRTRRF